jgi:hypothetical protein
MSIAEKGPLRLAIMVNPESVETGQYGIHKLGLLSLLFLDQCPC